jgi:hypothetical protein
MIEKLPTTVGELQAYADQVRLRERDRCAGVIENVRDTWVRPSALNYQRELTKLVALIKGEQNGNV